MHSNMQHLNWFLRFVFCNQVNIVFHVFSPLFARWLSASSLNCDAVGAISSLTLIGQLSPGAFFDRQNDQKHQHCHAGWPDARQCHVPADYRAGHGHGRDRTQSPLRGDIQFHTGIHLRPRHPQLGRNVSKRGRHDGPLVLPPPRATCRFDGVHFCGWVGNRLFNLYLVHIKYLLGLSFQVFLL